MPKIIRQKEEPPRKGDFSHYRASPFGLALGILFRCLIQYQGGWEEEIAEVFRGNKDSLSAKSTITVNTLYAESTCNFLFSACGRIRVPSEFHPRHLCLRCKPDLSSASYRRPYLLWQTRVSQILLHIRVTWEALKTLND